MAALMFHDLVSHGDEDRSGFPGRDAALYKVTKQRFEEHVSAVARDRRLLNAPPAPAFTFDDGGVSAMEAADLLERHGLVGHFFITTNYIGAHTFLSAQQIRELH